MDKELSIDDLQLDPNNARKRSEAAKKNLAHSLDEFGAARSVVMDADGVIRAGNGTVEAAKEAGITKVRIVEGSPDELIVVKRADMSGEQAMAYAIADNRAGELAEWDLDELGKQLEGLTAYDASDMGFDEEALSELFPESEPAIEPEEVEPQIDRAAELQKEWGTESGQLWIIEGKQSHRLLCGDSTKVPDVERLMDGEKADCVVTDPPYGIGHSGKGIAGEAAANDFGEIAGDVDTKAAEGAFAIFNEWNIPMVVWGANYYPQLMPKGYGWLIWDKKREGETFSGAEIAFCNQGVRVDVFRHQWHGMIKESERGQKRVHPTQSR